MKSFYIFLATATFILLSLLTGVIGISQLQYNFIEGHLISVEIFNPLIILSALFLITGVMTPIIGLAYTSFSDKPTRGKEQ